MEINFGRHSWQNAGFCGSEQESEKPTDFHERVEFVCASPTDISRCRGWRTLFDPFRVGQGGAMSRGGYPSLSHSAPSGQFAAEKIGSLVGSPPPGGNTAARATDRHIPGSSLNSPRSRQRSSHHSASRDGAFRETHGPKHAASDFPQASFAEISQGNAWRHQP